jgi:hypothetical protein
VCVGTDRRFPDMELDDDVVIRPDEVAGEGSEACRSILAPDDGTDSKYS